ncbi:FAD-binding oxidoreductase [Kitasatospora sp. NPDC089797]|uniref:FAD-binding oxidoreductase n=1 Tax=Kitasatospora sp. NPDC089797 TaxID=3155298 RepID=UPI00344A90C4
MTLKNRSGQAVAPEHVDALRTTVRGQVFAQDDEGYARARLVWNGYFNRHPGLIVRCAGAADVVEAVRFATRHDIRLAVRSGGHSYPGHSTIDDGLVVDLSGLKGIRVDLQRGVAICEPGLLLAELDDETYRFGLAVTGGQVSHTGIAGLTLGGGIGWLCRSRGLTVDNLVAADVVLADGEVRRASAEDDADLFWAIRGGGGNFGIVTSFEYRLHPQGACRTGIVAYRAGDHAAVATGLSAFAATAPDRLALAVGLFDLADGDTGIAIRYVDTAPAEDTGALVDALAGFGPEPVLRTSETMPYPKVQQLADADMAHHRRYYTRSFMIETVTAEALAGLIEGFRTRKSELSQIGMMLLGGEVARVAPDATAYPHREPGFLVTLLGGWTDEQDDAANTAWCRETYDTLQRFTSGGVYVNELLDEGERRIVSAYGADHYRRLSELKAKYDPANTFRVNQNIKPAAPADA